MALTDRGARIIQIFAFLARAFIGFFVDCFKSLFEKDLGLLFRPFLSADCTRFPQINQLSGAGRTRTDDPLLAKQMLSQLSYNPNRLNNQSSSREWARVDSNHGPRRYQRRALTN